MDYFVYSDMFWLIYFQSFEEANKNFKKIKNKEIKIKKDTNKCIFRTEGDSQTLRNLGLPKGTVGKDGLGV